MTKSNIQQGSGIKCPKCFGKTKVTITKPHPQVNIMGRYRKCLVCGETLYTEEVIIRKII